LAAIAQVHSFQVKDNQLSENRALDLMPFGIAKKLAILSLPQMMDKKLLRLNFLTHGFWSLFSWPTEV
jgi:hypothetical protein